jgi:hypothetical protein
MFTVYLANFHHFAYEFDHVCRFVDDLDFLDFKCLMYPDKDSFGGDIKPEHFESYIVLLMASLVTSQIQS